MDIVIGVVVGVLVTFMLLSFIGFIATQKIVKNDKVKTFGLIINDKYHSFDEISEFLDKVKDGAFYIRRGDDVPLILPSLVGAKALEFDDTFADDSGLPLKVVKGKLYDKYEKLLYHMGESNRILDEIFN